MEQQGLINHDLLQACIKRKVHSSLLNDYQIISRLQKLSLLVIGCQLLCNRDTMKVLDNQQC